ncbi:MAG: hypothetical protein GY806_05930 [Gammaproteobacteria bacterium]|nr:hypothetical protein [Gammaproteobacteria bacterium]
MKIRYYQTLLILLLTLTCSTGNTTAAQQYEIQLQSSDGDQTIPVALLQLTPNEAGWDYQLKMNEVGFGDYFLSMRPFKCTTDKVNMLCHLAYPYQINRKISKADLVDLEYDLLFIRRKPTDYGINPWNGLYYKLRWRDGLIEGKAHEVDLDLLAVPPEDNQIRPIQSHDLHEIDGKQLWLPKLVSQPQN